MHQLLHLGLRAFLALAVFACQSAGSEKAKENPQDCAHCGMPTAKYANWKAEALFAGTWKSFCSPRCSFFFVQKQGTKPDSLVVNDFYNLEKIDGKRCSYVVGSDVMGPMGHDLVPVHGPEAADGFMVEHLGKEILRYDSISAEVLQKLGQY